MVDVVNYLIVGTFGVGLLVFFVALLGGLGMAALLAVRRESMSKAQIACVIKVGRIGGLIMIAAIAAGIAGSALRSTLFQ